VEGLIGAGTGRRGTNGPVTFKVSHFVYYESINVDLKIRPTQDCRCEERLKTKSERSTHLGYTVLCGGLEHLKNRDEVNRREVCECDG
jgi:hypothetical protein